MKVAELRIKLAKLKKEEIIKLAAEFYKLVPKAKKEDYKLDELVENPSVKTRKKQSSSTSMSLDQIGEEVNLFIEHARKQYYFAPNQVVRKRERPKWRFKVKRWYKELINVNRKDANLVKQEILLIKLYQLMCEACGVYYFSSTEPFQSIQIEQEVFLESVLNLTNVVKGRTAVAERGVDLIINHGSGGNTLKSYLMKVFIQNLPIPDLKYKAIECTEKQLKKLNYNPSKYKRFDRKGYRANDKNNHLAKLGCRLYLALQEYDEVIEFYNKHYHHSNSKEIELYVLIDILFEHRLKDCIKRELEGAIKKGIKPRKNLMKLLKTIQEEDKLPQRMW